MRLFKCIDNLVLVCLNRFMNAVCAMNYAKYRCRSIAIHYDGNEIEGGLRLDLIVENSLIVELKAVNKLLPIHEAQLFTYLKLTGNRLGLLINFNVTLLKEGIKRVVR